MPYTDIQKAENSLRTARRKYEDLSGSSDTAGRTKALYSWDDRSKQYFSLCAEPDVAQSLRNRFIEVGLPTYGFDTKPSQGLESRWFILGCVLLLFALAFVIWGFSLAKLTWDQQRLLVSALPLASGFSAAAFAGSIYTQARNWIPGIAHEAIGKAYNPDKRIIEINNETLVFSKMFPTANIIPDGCHVLRTINAHRGFHCFHAAVRRVRRSEVRAEVGNSLEHLRLDQPAVRRIRGSLMTPDKLFHVRDRAS
jgi:hypothetical protein